MRALLITLDGIQETMIGVKVESTYRLIEGTPPPKRNVESEDNLTSMYRLLDCDLVDGAGYPDRSHAAWIDDDGIAKVTDGSQGNIVSWYPETLYGKILVTGFDPYTGETTEATMSAKELSHMVKVGELRLV